MNTAVEVGPVPGHARPIKLACRNVWKLFGSDAENFIKSRDGRASADALQQAGLVGAVRAVDLDIREGEIFIVMGLSGSGKSTLVRCLSRLIEPTSGKIEFDGKDLLTISDAELIELRRHKWAWCSSISRCCRISTSSTTSPFRSSVQGVDRDEREARAPEMIELVGLGGRENYYPARAVRRPAAARRHRAQPRRRARDLVSRRAVLRARSADPPRDAGRVPAAAERAEEDHRLHHPRFRRGDPARRPHRHHEGRRDRPDRHAGGAGARSGRPTTSPSSPATCSAPR